MFVWFVYFFFSQTGTLHPDYNQIYIDILYFSKNIYIYVYIFL